MLRCCAIGAVVGLRVVVDSSPVHLISLDAVYYYHTLLRSQKVPALGVMMQVQVMSLRNQVILVFAPSLFTVAVVVVNVATAIAVVVAVIDLALVLIIVHGSLGDGAGTMPVRIKALVMV